MIHNVIDTKAGTHFAGITLVCSHHARKRAVEHFGIKDSDVGSYVAIRLKKAALIDEDFTGEDGNIGRLFVHESVCYIVAKDGPLVITLYPQENTALDAVINPVAAAVKRIIRAAQRSEKAELQRLNRERAQYNVMIAEAELELTYTSQPAKIRKLTEEVSGHKTQIKRIDDEIFTVRRAKATVLKGVCAFV